MTLRLPDPTVVVDTPDGTLLDAWGVQRDFEALALRFPVGAPDLQSGQAGTTFPTAPVNGQEFFYVADATGGIEWHFKYRSASASASKWEFVGGPPLYAEAAGGDVLPVNNGAYVALPAAGPSVPSLTAPLAGDYQVTIGCTLEHDSAAGESRMSYDIGGTGAVDPDSLRAFFVAGSAGTWVPAVRQRLQAGLAAGTALVCKYRGNGQPGPGRFESRWITILPVRVT